MTTATETLIDDDLQTEYQLVFDPELLQGSWTEEQYLRMSDYTNRLMEFSDGLIEVLPMPTDKHQTVLRTLFLLFYTFIAARGGTAQFSPLRLRIRPRKFREPDLLLLLSASDSRRENRYWHGADLVLEVVSSDKPERDLRDKRDDYAEAGIPEYWIANPQDETITVLRLEGNVYVEHGVFHRGATATSALLAGFSAGVDAVFDAV